MKLSAVVIPVSARKLVNGRSASSGMIWSNASPTAAPIPVRWREILRRFRVAGEQPADQANQNQAFENTQHRGVQQQIRDIVEVDTV